MPIRRAADPSSVQHIWDAMKNSAVQRQMADSKRIIKYLQKVDKCTQTQAELYIQQTMHDDLIVFVSQNQSPAQNSKPNLSRALQKVTKTAKGDVVDSFRLPTQEMPELDGKDWYCFECHLAGDVTECRECFRVFHADCIPSGQRKFEEFKKTNYLYDQNRSVPTLSQSVSINISSDSEELNASDLSFKQLNNNEAQNGQTRDEHIYDEGLCTMCNISKTDNDNLETAELNYLLKFVIHRIQSWVNLPNTIMHTMSVEERAEPLTDKELTWRANHLFFEHRDMSVIEVNLNSETYTHIHQFLGDVLTIQHNVAIFHGIESQEYGAAELMVRDCIHDLTELKLCVDCYKHSNEKINTKWFCLPCRVPHRLVWAKQKGYPYWPAKVIREMDSHFDVRFFGGKYERSLLIKSQIKPIETPQSKLSIKTSSAFNKSVEELRFHQKLLQNPEELQQVVAASKNRARTSKPKTPIGAGKGPRSGNHSFDVPDVYQFEDVPCAQGASYAQDRFKRKGTNGDDGNKRKSLKGDDLKGVSDNVIHISDGEEDEEFSYREDYGGAEVGYNNGVHEQVSSSTENCRSGENSLCLTTENGMQLLDHPYSDSVEKMRRRLEGLTDRSDLIKCAMGSMQSELDKITNDHNDHLKRLFESHNTQISETKKKQWCYNCEQEAIYHCCWNTAYCSQSCQQQHWLAEHKKVCRRKQR